MFARTVTVIRPCRTRSMLRCMNTLNLSHLSMDRYHRLSDKTMDALVDELENLLDKHSNRNYEVEYHSGVLTLRLGDQGTYVINKQPPNKQIWLSSPFSGPKRYDYTESDAKWRYSRDGQGLTELLNDELGRVFNERLQLLSSKS